MARVLVELLEALLQDVLPEAKAFAFTNERHGLDANGS